MEIAIFQEITTEDALTKLEADGKKYEGLYVDMNVAEERKYVKENAALINDLLKKLDRARIDKSKAYKQQVESEAKDIRERLEAANLPFTMLIDAHKHERAMILAAEKAKAAEAALALQIEADHETALLMDKVQMIEKAEREAERIANEDRLKKEAADLAVSQEQERVRREAEAKEADRLQREADKQHVTNILTKTKVSLMNIGLDEKVAIDVVKAIRNCEIYNVSITY
jgi:hypothetical protein